MSAGNSSQDTMNWNQGKWILPASLTSIKTRQTESTRCLTQSESCLPSWEERCFPGKLALLIASYHWGSKVHGEQGPRGRTYTGLQAPAVRAGGGKNSCWRLCFSASKTKFLPSRRLISLSLQPTSPIIIRCIPLYRIKRMVLLKIYVQNYMER